MTPASTKSVCRARNLQRSDPQPASLRGSDGTHTSTNTIHDLGWGTHGAAFHGALLA
jgi:hypothetical protein